MSLPQWSNPFSPAPPIPPTPLLPRIVKTERIAPLSDGASGTMGQQANTTFANAHRTKKHKKQVARPTKRPLKTTPASTR
jgi:hypothetical protein